MSHDAPIPALISQTGEGEAGAMTGGGSVNSVSSCMPWTEWLNPPILSSRSPIGRAIIVDLWRETATEEKSLGGCKISLIGPCSHHWLAQLPQALWGLYPPICTDKHAPVCKTDADPMMTDHVEIATYSGRNCAPTNPHVEVLTPGTSGCNCIWR